MDKWIPKRLSNLVTTAIVTTLLFGLCARYATAQETDAPSDAAATAKQEKQEKQKKTDTPKTDKKVDKEAEKPEKWPKFIGMPIPIISPTVDLGLAAILMLSYPINADDKVSPPSSTTLFGMGTTNKSWATGAMQQLYFNKDDIRLTVAGAYGVFNSTFYGVGEMTYFPDFQVPLGTSMGMLVTRFLKHAIGRLYLGLQYRAMWATSEFDLTVLEIGDLEILQPYTVEGFQSGLGAIAEYDSRDSQFSATKGWYVKANSLFYARALGGDDNYSLFDLGINKYQSITSDKYILAFRAFAAGASEDTPVYSLPVIGQGADLRGYDYGRYRNKMILATQVEFRWNFVWRFYMVAFAGMGTSAEGLSELDDAPFLGSYGGGIRFNVHPKQRMMLRIDYARGNEDGFFYFGVNEAF